MNIHALHGDTQYFLAHPESIEWICPDTGRSVLSFAASRKYNDGLVSLALSKELNVNACDLDGATALHYAASCSASICKLLMDAGADPSIRISIRADHSQAGRKAVDIANWFGNYDAVQIITRGTYLLG